MNKRNQEYHIGLDIGTNSVGWAVTDNNYDLLNIKKKNLWGVRLFAAADTAEGRRVNRSTRRRYFRRKNRINWLNEIFAEALFQKDPSFLTRLQSSWVSKKDHERHREHYNLFMDKNYTDTEYHQEYPTIYHLRKDLITNPDKQFDIRLIYLAAHNIIKYRGNFTFEHQKFSISEMNNNLTLQLQNFYAQLGAFNLSLPSDADFTKISSILIQSGNPTKKIDLIKSILKLDKDTWKIAQETLKLLLGNSANLNNILQLSLEKDDSKLSFSDKNIDASLETLEGLLTDEQFQLITSANEIFSAITLNEILKGNKYLSSAKIQQYNDHKKDLEDLRIMWHQTENEELVYNARQAYKKYINSKGYDVNNLYSDINKFLLEAEPKNLAQKALKRIDNNEYLLKPRNSENGVIPFQLNKIELEKILENQSKYYSFLKDNKDKIISILSFRIPYYVGPIQTSDKSSFAWMEKRTNASARPWNFDEVIDRDKSSNNFIKRMTATDTFLIGEPVLPKYSLIYQRYEVLNELNNIRITEDIKTDPNGSKLPLKVKQEIFDDLFKKNKVIKSDRLKKWLIAQSYYVSPKIIGLSDPTQFNSGLTTFIDMKRLFGQSFVEDSSNSDQLEELVEWLTIFEDKQILSEKLKKSSHEYSDDQIKKIANMRYKGWGRVSKKLLCDIKVKTTTYQSHQLKNLSIIDLMWETKKNFISILKDDKYGFEEMIDDYNLNSDHQLSTADLIDDIHTSPALKRGITQSINIVQELVKFMGHAPKHIFIEFTREDNRSELTDSRKKRVTRLYKKLNSDSKSFKVKLKEYLVPDKDIQEDLKKNKNNLSNERMMLYFLQNGKSLYSGESLQINELSKYQVDHILPQTYIKDDSIENKALVLAEENQRKSDDLLLKSTIIDENLERWTYMRDNGMMGPKKFKNLTRRTITDDDQMHFINRQLVQTSQIIKKVSNILDSIYQDEGTTCIQARANLSSSFRKAFSNQGDDYHFEHPEFVKNRNINDYHHAQDAYLACLLGLYRMKKFPSDEMLLIKGEYRAFFAKAQAQFNKKGKVPDSNKNGFILTPLITGETQHDAKTDKPIWNLNYKKKVEQIFHYHQYNVTRRTEIQTGEFYKQTLYSPKDPKIKNLIARKDNLDPQIYGGYSGANAAYIVIVKIDNKKFKLVSVPIRLSKKFDENKAALQPWLEENIKHKTSIEIIKTKIPLGQLTYNKQNGYLALKSEKEIVNEQQLVLPAEDVALLTLLQSTDSEYDQILSFYDKNILDNIFQSIISKMQQFYPFYKNELKFFNSVIDTFKTAPLNDKVNTLQQLLIMLHANSSNASFELDGIKKTRFGRKSSGLQFDSIDLIYQSVTGLYENTLHIE